MILKTISKKSVDIILDEDDYGKVNQLNWYNRKNGDKMSIYTRIDGKMISLKRYLYDLKTGQVIIHQNGNQLDYSKDNIQILTRTEYGHRYGNVTREKTSKYNGVYFCQTTGKWWVRVIKAGKILGDHCYTEELEAAIAADYLYIKYYGDKANRNFPELDAQEIKHTYEAIRKKYGISKKEIKAKATQGVSSAKNKASHYVGVTRDKRRKKQWVASIKYQVKKIHLGSFEKEFDAAKAYDSKAIELYGEHARTNF